MCGQALDHRVPSEPSRRTASEAPRSYSCGVIPGLEPLDAIRYVRSSDTATGPALVLRMEDICVSDSDEVRGAASGAGHHCGR